MTRAKKIATPVDLYTTGWAMATMMAEAQMVVGLRCLGLAGVWAVAPGETQRMVSEKAPVFAQAGQDAWAKALSGARPDEVMAAWLRPISRKTHANSVRLAKRGPKFR